jgi:hypothetical protein
MVVNTYLRRVTAKAPKVRESLALFVGQMVDALDFAFCRDAHNEKSTVQVAVGERGNRRHDLFIYQPLEIAFTHKSARSGSLSFFSVEVLPFKIGIIGRCDESPMSVGILENFAWFRHSSLSIELLNLRFSDLRN